MPRPFAPLCAALTALFFAAAAHAPAVFAAGPPPVTAPADDSKEADNPTSALGKTFDSLPVQTTAGEKLDIAKEKGWKVVYFWSPVCPCVRNCQSLTLFPLSREYQAKGVKFFAVASNASNVKTLGNKGKGRATLAASGGMGQIPPFALVLDPGHKAADRLGAEKTPQTFLLDPQNRVVFVGNPDDSEEILEKTGRAGEKTKDYLADALRDALAGRAPSRATAPVLGCDILRYSPGAFD